MSIDEITSFIESLGGVHVLQPREGDGTPEIAWGDSFFYYSPEGIVPSTQPFATIVTKDYPDEPSSGLDRAGAFRLNIASGAELFAAHTAQAREGDDVVLPHPVYSAMHWLCVVNPAARSDAAVRELITSAHQAARARYERRDAMR